MPDSSDENMPSDAEIAVAWKRVSVGLTPLGEKNIQGIFAMGYRLGAKRVSTPGNAP